MQKWVFIAAILTANLVQAQPSQILFDHYGLDAGFNSREAMNIVTTPNGMVWVSSNDGLARFDGKRFKFYQHISGDSNSLANNYCKAIQTDKRGQIWIASSKDLDVFNPASEKFIHIKTPEKNKEKQPVYPICFYYDSTNDIMWVGTARGLYFSKNGSFTLQSVASLTTEKILVSSMIGTISTEGNGILWVTAWRDIIKLNTKNGDIEKYELPDYVDNIFNESKQINFRSSYLENNKTLWLGAWLTGLVEFNTVTKTFHQYCFRDYKKEQNTIYHITKTGLVEQENILWLSTDGFGLTAFDIQQKKFTSYAASLGNDPYGIKGTTYGLFTDRDKAMWIGSATGLHRYDYSKQLFKKIDLSNIEKGSGLTVSLMELQQNKQSLDEIIWLYIAFRGGYLYNLREKKIMQVPAKVAAYINMPTQVLSFYIDTKNILWISSVEYGLTGYDIDKDDIVFTDDKLFREKWKWASGFYEDNKKRLWIGTYHGLYMMDSSRKNIGSH